MKTLKFNTPYGGRFIALKLLMILSVFAVTCGISIAIAPEKTMLKAGVARVVISPETPRIMVNKVTSEGVLHHIYARALSLNDGMNRLIIVTYDLNCLDVATPLVRKRVKNELGIDPSHLVLLATHNHNAPLSSLPPNFDYGASLADKIFNIIREAISNEKGPVSLKFGTGYGYYLRAEGSAPADYEIQVLKIDYRNRPLAVLFNQPVHPVRAVSNKIDPEHPGYAMDEIEKHYPGIMALYADACGGNQEPVNVTGLTTKDPLERTLAYGHSVAKEVIRVMDSPMEEITGPIKTNMDHVSLPLAPPATYEEVMELTKKYPENTGFVPTGPLEATNWVRMMLRYYEKHLPMPKSTGDMICTFDAYLINKSDNELLEKYSSSINRDYPNIFEEVIVSSIGKMAFIAMQGEVCAPIGMRIKDAFRREMPVMVFGYMGEQNLYIPTRELVRKKVYQGVVIQTQFASPVGWAPEVEDEMVDAVIRLTKSVTGENK
jgi:neutral ceramidase